MKKIISYLSAVFIAGSLIGCGTAAGGSLPAGNDGTADDGAAVEQTAEPEKESYDEDFLNDFSEAIQARWALSSDDATADDIREMVKTELSIIGPNDYRNKPFADRHLHEDALVYLNALDGQQELLDSFTGDDMPEEKYQEWADLVQKRYDIIVDLYDNYGLKIDSKYILMVNKTHNSYYINKYGKDAFDRMLNSWESTYPLADSTGAKGECYDLTNITPYDFKNIDLIVMLLEPDEAGDNYNYVDTVATQSIGEWKSGEMITIKILEEDLNAAGIAEGEAFVIYTDWE